MRTGSKEGEINYWFPTIPKEKRAKRKWKIALTVNGYLQPRFVVAFTKKTPIKEMKRTCLRDEHHPNA